MKKFDSIIIGFGKGGKTLAGALAASGMTVALLERSEKMYGGTCINVGCIPSKSLITSAKESEKIGGDFLEKSARYKQAVIERERVTSMLRKKNYDKLFSNPNVTILTGNAEFTGEKTVKITYQDKTSEELTAPRIFINTGSKPFIPPIPGVNESSYVYLSETLMEKESLPKRLIIIGGGYIGIEFASMYASFGSEVTVVQDGGVFLPREDEEIAQAVQKRLAAMGVRVLFSANVEGIEDKDEYAEVTIKSPSGFKVLPADAVLVAAGRRPNLEGLCPEKAGVSLTERGAIKTDEHLMTTAPEIFAMGDVVGLQFTYISLDDYRIVKSAVLGDKSRTTKNRGAVPYSVFLDPPFSRVGFSEKEAKKQGYKVKIARLPVAAIPKAQVLRETEGILKAVIDEESGKILGAHLFCPKSHEIINILKLAIDAAIPYTVLQNGIFTHPTMAEALNDLFAD